MSGTDPFRAGVRWRWPVGLAAVGALALLTTTMGVVAPLRGGVGEDDLRAGIVSDFYRIEHAAQAYVQDTGDFPGPAFDLSDGYDGGLRRRASAPPRQQGSWKGPYLELPPARPTPQSFWSLAEPQTMLDADGDGAADELWARLHRGYGELGDETAAWLDRVLDDGQAGGGALRVTPTWIWFKLLER
jgi:hypothetical protein